MPIVDYYDPTENLGTGPEKSSSGGAPVPPRKPTDQPTTTDGGGSRPGPLGERMHTYEEPVSSGSGGGPGSGSSGGNPGGGNGGGGLGGAPGAGGVSNATPIDTSAAPGDYYSGAAGTTSRITQGVDMSDKIAEANNAWSKATGQYAGQSGDIIDQYGQNTNAGINQYQGNAQAIIDQLKGLTGDELARYAQSTGQTIAEATKQINDILAGMQDSLNPVGADRVGRVDTVEEENLLKQITDAQKEQSENKINYAVQQAVDALERAKEDAAPQFQTQRDQIAAAERNALDNQALYAEARGDRGGIGQAQYNAIQNAAATNQLTVNNAQTKLATDTARQIADLRAQGEFQKADELLSITQSYLGQLMQLKQWADEANIGIDEFNIGVQQWEQEYNAKIQQTLGELGLNATQYLTGLNLDNQQQITQQNLGAAERDANLNLGLQQDLQSQRQSLNQALTQMGLSNAQYVTDQQINQIANILSAYQRNAENMANTEMAAANLTGAFSDATPTTAARAQNAQRLASAAEQMIASGITPTDAQLDALGWGRDQYNAYKKAIDDAAAALQSGGYSKEDAYKITQDMIAGNKSPEDILTFLTSAEASKAFRNVDAAQALLDDAVNNVGYGTKNGTGQR